MSNPKPRMTYHASNGEHKDYALHQDGTHSVYAHDFLDKNGGSADWDDIPNEDKGYFEDCEDFKQRNLNKFDNSDDSNDLQEA